MEYLKKNVNWEDLTDLNFPESLLCRLQMAQEC